MKKISFLFLGVLLAGFGLQGQTKIAVVALDGTTTICTTLDSAITIASAGSSLYLSAGGFQVSESSLINKKLTIIGVGHRPDVGDGNTNVSGNLRFVPGADNSAVMGLYLSGNVFIGTTAGGVNNFLLRYCNVNSVQVQHSNCQGVVINQNYLRNLSRGGDSPVSFTNNILHSIRNVNGGIISFNLVRYNFHFSSNECAGVYTTYALGCITASQINNNIFSEWGARIPHSASCLVSNNAVPSAWGDNSIVVTDWGDVFEGPDNGVTPNSNFHLKEGVWKTGATDGGEVGIYGGTGFSDTALPPGPRIISKKIADQTDADGKLRIEIEVGAE
jgi:hypothetical protein